MQFLKFLANKLRITQTEFLIENIQPNWLLNSRQTLNFKLVFGLIISLVYGFLGFIYGCIFGFMTPGLIFGLIIGFIVGITYALISGLDNIKTVEAIQFSFTPTKLKFFLQA